MLCQYDLPMHPLKCYESPERSGLSDLTKTSMSQSTAAVFTAHSMHDMPLMCLMRCFPSSLTIMRDIAYDPYSKLPYFAMASSMLISPFPTWKAARRT